MLARDRAQLEATAAELKHDPVVIPADLADPAAPAAAAGAALDALGAVHILVNHAAAAARQPALELDAALIDGLYAVNVRAPLLLVAALLPSMLDRGAGEEQGHPRRGGGGRGPDPAPALVDP